MCRGTPIGLCKGEDKDGSSENQLCSKQNSVLENSFVDKDLKEHLSSCSFVPGARYNHTEVINPIHNNSLMLGLVKEERYPDTFDCLNRMDEAEYIFKRKIYEEAESKFQLKYLPGHNATGFNCTSPPRQCKNEQKKWYSEWSLS